MNGAIEYEHLDQTQDVMPISRQYAGGDRGAFKTICGKVRRCNRENLEPVIELAVEIAREGREGRRIGTLFNFGDAEEVPARSRPLILDGARNT